MKVLIVSPTSKGIGGIAQHVQGLSHFLQSQNYQVEIISSENTFTIPVKGLKNPSFMISAFLKTKFKKGNDIIHAHNIPAALAMKNISGKKILSIHGIYSKQIENLHNRTTSKIATNYEKDALNWADAITVVSKEAQDHYSKLGYEIYYIPNAIDVEIFPKSQKRLYEKQAIFAGRLSSEKGIETLYEIAEKLPDDIHLVILGTGPKEDQIKNLSKKNIHYLGYQSKEKTIELIRGSDILIQPSLIEGISSTILEAMACKTPIIATDIGGNKEIITNNQTGFLVEKNSSSQFLKKINNVFADASKLELIKNNAYICVQKYTWKNIGKKYLELYEKLLE